MVDGMVNSPFMEPSGPIRREGNRATCDLARGYGVRLKRWKGGRREGNSGDFSMQSEWSQEKDCNLRSWTLEDRKTQVSGHRGLSSGVASGKSSRSRYAYGWVETSTPLSSRLH